MDANREVTLTDIAPYLSDRGRVEVDLALQTLRLSVAQQELERLRAQVAVPDEQIEE